MDHLALLLRVTLAGSSRDEELRHDVRSRGPALMATDAAAPAVFTALLEQLGLTLEASRASLDAFVIDRLERPTEN
jgi:uncharacterized protein (TIGR03435 family)